MSSTQFFTHQIPAQHLKQSAHVNADIWIHRWKPKLWEPFWEYYLVLDSLAINIIHCLRNCKMKTQKELTSNSIKKCHLPSFFSSSNLGHFRKKAAMLPFAFLMKAHSHMQCHDKNPSKISLSWRHLPQLQCLFKVLRRSFKFHTKLVTDLRKMCVE